MKCSEHRTLHQRVRDEIVLGCCVRKKEGSVRLSEMTYQVHTTQATTKRKTTNNNYQLNVHGSSTYPIGYIAKLHEVTYSVAPLSNISLLTAHVTNPLRTGIIIC